MSNKKMIREIKKLINQNDNANFLGINKKGKFLVKHGNVTKIYTFPLTPSNTKYPIKEVKKILEKAY